jgi:hypothetical protein
MAESPTDVKLEPEPDFPKEDIFGELDGDLLTDATVDQPGAKSPMQGHKRLGGAPEDEVPKKKLRVCKVCMEELDLNQYDEIKSKVKARRRHGIYHKMTMDAFLTYYQKPENGGYTEVGAMQFWQEKTQGVKAADRMGVMKGAGGCERYRIRIGSESFSESASIDEREYRRGRKAKKAPDADAAEFLAGTARFAVSSDDDLDVVLGTGAASCSEASKSNRGGDTPSKAIKLETSSARTASPAKSVAGDGQQVDQEEGGGSANKSRWKKASAVAKCLGDFDAGMSLIEATADQARSQIQLTKTATWARSMRATWRSTWIVPSCLRCWWPTRLRS